jgi:SAM-dependent methyltransferase
MEAEFAKIYKKKIWGKNASGQGSSGTGSKMSPDNIWYNKLLLSTIKKHNIQNVVDIGCGDWETTKHIEFPCPYTGIDCVPHIIEENKSRYSCDNVTFYHRDIIENKIQGFDLVVMKDVIQHWNDVSIRQILPQLLRDNKFVLLTNGYKFGRTPEKNNWEIRDINNKYRYHPVDYTKSPLKEIDFFVLEIYHRRYKQSVLLSS